MNSNTVYAEPAGIIRLLNRDNENSGTPLHEILNFYENMQRNGGGGRTGVDVIKRCYTCAAMKLLPPVFPTPSLQNPGLEIKN